jgi:hypothetical protein
LVLGIVFLLLALTSPIWAITDGVVGGDYATTTIGWTSWTAMEYHSGVWFRTTTESYTAPGTVLPALANAAGAAYLLIVVLIVVLVAAFALISSWFSLHLHGLSLLILGLIVVVFALVALFYAVLTIPSAAATDLRNAAVTGFWGASGITSWGAGLGWWFLLIGVLFGILGGVWPFLKSMRQPMVRPPPPREWQVER